MASFQFGKVNNEAMNYMRTSRRDKVTCVMTQIFKNVSFVNASIGISIVFGGNKLPAANPVWAQTNDE